MATASASAAFSLDQVVQASRRGKLIPGLAKLCRSLKNDHVGIIEGLPRLSKELKRIKLYNCLIEDPECLLSSLLTICVSYGECGADMLRHKTCSCACMRASICVLQHQGACV